jgi:YD repeat-containing protein
VCAQDKRWRRDRFVYKKNGNNPLTTDDDVTYLARLILPGNQITDYAYDQFGRITTVRDSLAADVVAAGVRPNDDSVTTQLSYDSIGRVINVIAPSGAAGGKRIEHTFDYKSSATEMHIVGASEPNGFSKRVEYDSLWRTVKETDLTGKSASQEWDSIKDLQLSKTDATGLKSTTIYDKDDRATDGYGPAPAEWFGSDRKPIAAKVNDVPHTSSAYDEGINGPAVTYMAIKDRESSVLWTNQSLSRGQSIKSTDGQYEFKYQSDGNVTLSGPAGILWSNSKSGVASDRLTMQSDGNLVLYSGGTVVWSSNTNSPGTPYLKVFNDGNAVIVNGNSGVWATGTGGKPYTSDNPTSLIGTPLLNTTNIGTSPAQVSQTYTTGSPIAKQTNWGMRMTGKLYLPTTGNWKFRIVSDGGIRMNIDDFNVINDWN